MNLEGGRRQMSRQLELPFDGTGEARRVERSEEALTAVHGNERSGASGLMEKVCERQNLQAALKRVRTNKGSPGIDGMTVEELPDFLRENYRLVSLSIETNYESLFDAASKRIDYSRFLERELLGFFARVVPIIESESESRELMRMAREYDYLFQVDDSIDDLFTVKKVLSEHYIEPGSDILMIVRELSSGALALFDDVQDILDGGAGTKLRDNTRELNDQLDNAYRRLLMLTANPERKDAGALFNFVTYNRRLMDKLLNFALLQHVEPAREERYNDHGSTTGP